jgi:signal transduction histidine kinase
MFQRARRSGPWVALYVAERNALLLARLRWAVLATLLGSLLWTAQAFFLDAGARTLRVEFLLASALVALGGWGLGVALPRQWSRLVVTACVLALAATMAAALRFAPGGFESASTAFVLLFMGTALVLPWGVGAQALVCAGGLAGYAWVLAGAQSLPSLLTLYIVLTAAAIAIIGAKLIDDVGAASFERSWQQGQIVSLACELAGDLEPGEVVGKVLERGMGLLGTQSGALTLRDAGRGVYRVEALAGPLSEGAGWMIGLEFPEEHPLMQRIVYQGALELPTDDPESPFLPLLEEYGVRRVLYIVVRSGHEVLGVLDFARVRDEGFGPGERLLARGLADQAALALRTARLVADLRRANHLKSQFVSTMSHELRTPLNAILGFADMARDHALDAPGREECLAHIEAAGRELLALIEDTLEIGKIEAGREELRLESVSLPTLWAELGQGCRRMPRRPEVALEWGGQVPAVALVTDPHKVTLIVRNLVGNALKFTESGTVRAETWMDGDRLVVRVADTGIGIRAEDQEAIFEMFRQADGSDSRRYGGTGLGLYIVRRCVHQLGGTIELESAPGRGSVFTVQLPRATIVPPVRDAA